MEIIERITETLEKTDKKATDLCDRLGIRTSTMSTWKTRNSDPPAKYIKPIAQAHHCRRGRTSRIVPGIATEQTI